VTFAGTKHRLKSVLLRNDKLKFVGHLSNMKPEVRIVEDAAALARAAATEFARLATESVRTKQLFTVVLSGGSTPKSLYALLATEPWCSQLPWNKIHFFWGDERQLPPDDANSNYRMAYEAMLAKAPVPAKNIHRIRGEETDPALAAQEYERELQNFFHLTSGQLPRFDLVLLGLGADGHTASLFPDTAAVHERDRLVLANWVAKLNAWRLTLTLPALNNAARVMFLVSGAEKANILRAVLESNVAEQYPAQLIRPSDGTLLWLVDRDAAASLEPHED
jgi:6-phosphogluconolactonase